MSSPEKHDPLLQYLIQRVEKMDEKVDSLLKFKWQIMGGAVVVSIFVTAAIQIASLLMHK